MGPKRDITGELEKEIRARGMKFIATFHHSRNLQRYADNPGEKDRKDIEARQRWFDSHFPNIPDTPPTSEDPRLRQLYGNMPEDVWLEMMWLAKLKEVIDQYEPDMIWFDAWLRAIPQEYQEKFAAYYLNRAKEQGRDVMIVRKNDDLPLEYSVNDFEKGRMATLAKDPWLTDDTISKGSWCYTKGLAIKSLPDVLHVFIDIVSKNGCLLLNISPKADGTIPENQREVLLGLGKWLDQNGEAIYGTRPFVTFGEGPTRIEKGGHFLKQTKYTPQDIRYTLNGKGTGTFYAIQLGLPKPGEEVLLRKVPQYIVPMDYQVKKVTLLGSDAEVPWESGNEGLSITVPEKLPNEVALVWRIGVE
ncbi:MAG: alpha-L-fucosidase, partial [Lacipirellulaceae bacterium]